MATLNEGHRIGPYQIVRLLGEGGMGAVYEALQEPIGRRVALKVLLPEYAHNGDVVTRFFNEARAVNLIEHPSLVQVSDFGRAADGTAYLVMEFLRGESLESRLRRLASVGQRLPTSTALTVAAQMAGALTAAHEKRIVHRDLKPANVMLVLDPVAPGGERAKILDFGIAKLTQHQGKGTNSKALLGTPRYMSPEQCRGAGEVDHKTDVYALGVILYEMLAGRTPFLGEGHGDFIGQHMFKEPPLLSEFAPSIPTDIGALTHRLLTKDRHQRPSMREAEAELSRQLSSISGALVSQKQASDLDATRQFPNVISPSTLGQSLGQTKRSGGGGPIWAVRAGVALVIMGVITVGVGYGIKGRGWVNTRQTVLQPEIPAPISAPRVPEERMQIAEHPPDLASPMLMERQPPAAFVKQALPPSAPPIATPAPSPSLAGPPTSLRPVNAPVSPGGEIRDTNSPRPSTPRQSPPPQLKQKKLDPYDF